MNYIGFSKYDTANGPGVRVSLFVAGCTLHCKGCFNEASWDFKAGKPFDAAAEAAVLRALDNPYVAGFSLLGGDPFEPEHERVLLGLLSTIKAKFPEKTIWAWTGRVFAHVKRSPLLSYIDVLVDGPFVEKKQVTEQGRWYGSTNQRILRIVPEGDGYGVVAYKK